MSKHIAIIGGGITGLATAFALAQVNNGQTEPMEISVFERDCRFGGKIQTRVEHGLVMETGPDSLLARKLEGLELFKQLGLDTELVGTNQNGLKTYVLHKAHLEPLPPGTNLGIPMQVAPFARTRLISWPGKARALCDLVIPRRPEQGDVSLGRFLRRRLGNDLVNHIAEPLMAGIYAGSIDDLSLQATFPQFAMLEDKYRSLIIGSMAQRRRLKAARSPAPRAQTAGSRSVFVTLKSGLEQLVDRLVESLRDRASLYLQTGVDRIRRTTDGRYELTVRTDGELRGVAIDGVIITAPAFVAADLLRDLAPETAPLKSIRYESTATVMTAFAASEVPRHLDASGFVVPRDERRAITACTWVSSKWPHSTTADQVLIRCYVGRTGDTTGLALADEAMVDLVREELKQIVGITATPQLARVTRWDLAMPQYRVNHERLVQEVETELRRATPGLVIAGAGYHGLGVPDCIAQGYAAARNMKEYLDSK